MIKILDGIKETVDFENNSTLLLYDNVENEEYPVHWHTPVEIVMPLVNDYIVECNDVPYRLREGDIIMIAPGILHHIYANEGRRIIFQVDLKMLQNFEEFDSFFSFMNPAIVITPEDYPAIHEDCARLMKEIFDEYFSNAPLNNIAIVSKFIQMLVMVGRAYTSSSERFTSIKPTKQQEYTEKLMSICDYINKHCTEDLTLEEVAEIAGFSKYHFSRLFKEFAGVTFLKYLNTRRIAYAEKLLLDPTISITEVAINSGFNSISAFLRMFKIIKGCTPTQFKNLNY